MSHPTARLFPASPHPAFSGSAAVATSAAIVSSVHPPQPQPQGAIAELRRKRRATDGAAKTSAAQPRGRQ